MATINFLYRSKKERASLTLRLLYRFEGADYVFATDSKVIVNKDYFVDKKEVVNGKVKITTTADFNKVFSDRANSDVIINNLRVASIQKQNELKSTIAHIEGFIIDEFNKINSATITKDWLKTQITNYYNPKKNEVIPTDLISFFDYYLDNKKNELNPPSVMKYKTIQMKLKKLQEYRKHTINVIDVNDSFKNEFIAYYRSENYAHNTIQREFSFIKTVCKRAKFLGLEVSHQLDGITIKAERVESIYLDLIDLKKIEESIQATQELETAKDWLLISAYCAQRLSDFMRFTPDMIRTEDNQMYIEFTQKKTGKIMSIPVHTKIINILNKRGFQFPDKLTPQNYNKLLKLVCAKAEINNVVYGGKEINKRKVYGMYKKYELCSSHIGRRSWVSNNYGTIPTSYLMYVSGHQTEAMLLRYLLKTNNDKAKEVAKYFK